MSGQQAEDRVDVAIIGGGIIGLLTAWMLRQRGVSVAVVERGRIGGESSWAGAGILSPINPWLYPDSFSHLVNHSLALYPALQAQLIERTGLSSEWRQCGLLVPHFAEDRVDHTAEALAWSSRFGWPVEHLDRGAARSLEPALADDVDSALCWPKVGQLRNPRLLQAVRRAAELDGVVLREHCEVLGLLENGPRVVGLRLAGNELLHSGNVLLAAGSWSGEFAAMVGMKLPVEPVKGQIVLLRGEPGVLHRIVKHDAAYFVPRADGHILVGASLERDGYRRSNTVAVVHALLDALHRIVPGLRGLEVEQMWTGFRPGCPDGMPYLGPVPNRPGLWVASGHYRNGVVLAPATAEAMADWISGSEPGIDLASFQVGRLPHHVHEALRLPQ